jgi:dCTP diphosphatase
MASISNDLLRALLEFRKERDWEQYHTPRNLAASLCIEASELLECFQWARDAELPDIVSRDRERIEDELADVAILMGYLDVVVRRKLKKNADKYPAHLARGNARKYDRLQTDDGPSQV